VLRGVGVTRALSPSPHASSRSLLSILRPARECCGLGGMLRAPGGSAPEQPQPPRPVHTHICCREPEPAAHAASSRRQAEDAHRPYSFMHCRCAGYAGFAHGSAPAVAAAAVPPVADAAAAARCPLCSAVCLLLVRPPLVVRAYSSDLPPLPLVGGCALHALTPTPPHKQLPPQPLLAAATRCQGATIAVIFLAPA
jgi:hypothetical protein